MKDSTEAMSDTHSPIPYGLGFLAVRRGDFYIDLFVTGVFPVTMDDETSGCNTATNIIPQVQFNDMLRPSDSQMCAMQGTYCKTGVPRDEVHKAHTHMREWYGGYRLLEDAAERHVDNPDIALHYPPVTIALAYPPERLAMRAYYGKQRQSLIVNRRQAEMENGEYSLARASGPRHYRHPNCHEEARRPPSTSGLGQRQYPATRGMCLCGPGTTQPLRVDDGRAKMTLYAAGVRRSASLCGRDGWRRRTRERHDWQASRSHCVLGLH